WLRRETAYQGLIVSDDLAMKALSGPVAGNARASINAGCDLVLYCPGDISGGQAAIDGAGPLSDRASVLWTAWVDTRPTPPQADAFALAAKLWALIETGAPVA
ncbi:MAG: glycoside hydrolase family 3 N-terminal domain-containing protein, partial [Alphaproteobacteria bacterium]